MVRKVLGTDGGGRRKQNTECGTQNAGERRKEKAVIARSGEEAESDEVISWEAAEPLLFPMVTREIASRMDSSR